MYTDLCFGVDLNFNDAASKPEFVLQGGTDSPCGTFTYIETETIKIAVDKKTGNYKLTAKDPGLQKAKPKFFANKKSVVKITDNWKKLKKLTNSM